MKKKQVNRRQLLFYLMIFIITPVITFTIGKQLDRLLRLPKYPPFPWNLFTGFGVFFFGLGLGVKSTRLLYNLGGGLPWGEIIEEAKTNQLVTKGPYRYVRNPMVLGYSFLPFGMGLFLQSLGMALSISPIVLMINIGIVKLKEERDLETRFGEEYVKYKKSTPFLVPHPVKVYNGAIQPALTDKQPQLIFTGLSIAGLLILTQLPFRSSTLTTIPNQSVIFLGSFTLICVIGFLAAVAPNIFKLSSHKKGTNTKSRGHHPDCVEFENHILYFRNKAYCAGCSGLAIGAIFAVFSLWNYFMSGYMPFNVEIVFWLGVVMVFLGLLQHFIDLGSPKIHFALNIVLVYGVSMITVSLDRMSVDIFTIVYMLGISLFWIMSRIRVSQEEHIDLCNACPKSCNIGYKTFDA